MTRDELIRMAREAGFVIDDISYHHQPNCVFHTYHLIDEPLARFARLVVAHEREACAKVCDLRGIRFFSESPFAMECHALAEAIRARGEK